MTTGDMMVPPPSQMTPQIPPRPQVRIIAERYLLLPESKSGGMAEVFSARDIHTDTKAAVKILSAGHLSAGILKESFEREVRSLGELRHPSIVRLIDHGFDDQSGFHFIVLEWAESDLSTLIHSHPIDSWDQFFATIFRPLLDG